MNYQSADIRRDEKNIRGEINMHKSPSSMPSELNQPAGIQSIHPQPAFSLHKCESGKISELLKPEYLNEETAHLWLEHKLLRESCCAVLSKHVNDSDGPGINTDDGFKSYSNKNFSLHFLLGNNMFNTTRA